MQLNSALISLFLLLWLNVVAYAADASSAGDRQPNVIVILTDDQGYGDLSCHGNPYLNTPAIDQLAAESVRLTDCHVDPTCSPTRAALLTGRYASRVGVWLTYGSRHHLNRDETTLADVFRGSGYRTAVFGKWHLGDNYPFRPHDRGFDESLVHGGGMIGETPDYWNNDYYDDTYFRNGQPERVQGYCTDVWFNEAKKFIERNRDRPFFLYLPTNAPHGPLHVPANYSQKYRDQAGVSAQRAYFYGMLDCIDQGIGQLRQHLVDLDLADNTIVVFMNDNGSGHGAELTSNGRPDRNGWETAGYNAGLRGRKASVYEGGHRAACFIHAPSVGVAGNRDLPGLTAHLDIMPTLIDLCGLQTTEAIAFDGVSLKAPLCDLNESVPDRTLVVHHQGRFGKRIGDGLPIKGKAFSVMSGRWRLVGKQLFDLDADPSQRHDVAAANLEVVARLTAQYDLWWTDISKSFATPNAFVIDPARQREVKISSQNLLGAKVAYSQHHVRGAMPLPDCWTWIDVQQPGTYKVVVRRWPQEVDATFDQVVAGHPVDQQRHEVTNSLMNLPSQSVPVTKVQLAVGDFDKSVAVSSTDAQAEFMVPLKPGLQKISSQLIAPDGRQTAAYYTYLSPVSTSTAPTQLPQVTQDQAAIDQPTPAENIPIWPELAPGETGDATGIKLVPRGKKLRVTRVSDIQKPTIDVFPADNPSGVGVVVLPGGGFNYVVPDLEGSEVAAILNRHGITVFVLRYRTKKNKQDPGWPQALQDAQRAMKVVRSDAPKWKLDPSKIGLIGFSAGGQVAARLLTDGGKRTYPSVDTIDQVPHRPDFAALVYPWNLYDSKTKSLKPEFKATQGLPPTFIVHTHDDRSSSLGSVLFYAELKRRDVPAELHVYQNGGHGYGVRSSPKTNIDAWPSQMLPWLRIGGWAN